MIHNFSQARSRDDLDWPPPIQRFLVFHPNPLKPLMRDPVLLSAFFVAGLIEVYQLTVTLLHPPWTATVTDWLRGVLAYPELGVVLCVSWWFTRTRRPGARSWWMLSLALLSYIIARSLWSLEDVFVYPGYVPFPSFPDLFFVLQYPFFFLAVILLPRLQPWGPRVKAILDCVLWMGAATALTWYFILDPMVKSSGESALGKAVNLAYPIGDLAVLFGLLIALTRQHLRRAESVALRLLILAVVCLALADVWVAAFLLYASPVYKTGNPPDLFWISFYLLVPLAGLVQLRLTQRAPTAYQPPTETRTSESTERRQDLMESLRGLLPSLTALFSSFIIVICAALVPIGFQNPLAPYLAAFGLLLLVLARQEITLLENERLRRFSLAAKAHELFVEQEASQHMSTFLGIASHELKTPLTSLKLCLQLGIRRGQQKMQRCGEVADQLTPFLEHLVRAERHVVQLDRLVNDLLMFRASEHGRSSDPYREWTDLHRSLLEAVE